MSPASSCRIAHALKHRKHEVEGAYWDLVNSVWPTECHAAQNRRLQRASSYKLLTSNNIMQACWHEYVHEPEGRLLTAFWLRMSLHGDTCKGTSMFTAETVVISQATMLCCWAYEHERARSSSLLLNVDCGDEFDAENANSAS